jgi:hypothetical protein
MLRQPVMQRLQPPAGAANPVGERRAVQLDAMAREDLRLAIERLVIAIFADQHMGEQAGTGETLRDRPFGRRRLVDGAAGPTARPADTDDAQSSRYPVEHLRDGLADGMDGAAAIRTSVTIDIETNVLAL